MDSRRVILHQHSCSAPASVDDSAPARPIRTWTSAGGKYQREAAYVATRGDDIVLRKRNDRRFVIALEKLCERDRAYVIAVRRHPGLTNEIEGKVAGITDGDTIRVLDDDKQTYKIRLEGIDAPESGQA